MGHFLGGVACGVVLTLFGLILWGIWIGSSGGIASEDTSAYGNDPRTSGGNSL